MALFNFVKKKKKRSLQPVLAVVAVHQIRLKKLMNVAKLKMVSAVSRYLVQAVSLVINSMNTQKKLLQK